MAPVMNAVLLLPLSISLVSMHPEIAIPGGMV